MAGFVVRVRVYCWLRDRCAWCVALLPAAAVRRDPGLQPAGHVLGPGAAVQAVGVRFVFDQHDLCPEVYAVALRPRTPAPATAALRLLERLDLSRSPIVVIATNESLPADRAIEPRRRAPERVVVVRSGPDLDALRRRRARARAQARRSAPPVPTSGSWARRTASTTLLRAARRPASERGRDDVHVALLGFGDCFDDLRALADELGLDDRVTFTGRVDRTRVAGYLSTADVGLSPGPQEPAQRRLDDEQDPRVHGPSGCRSSPSTCSETRVSAGDAAAYVADDDRHAFAAAIDELLDDPERRAAMGRVGRSRIESTLGWHRQVAAYVGVYEELLGAGAAGTTAQSGGQHMKVGDPGRRAGHPARGGDRDQPKPMVEIGGQPILWHIMKYYAPLRLQRLRRSRSATRASTSSATWSTTRRWRATSPSTSATGDVERHERRPPRTGRSTSSTPASDTATGGRIKRLAALPRRRARSCSPGATASPTSTSTSCSRSTGHGKLATLTAVRPPARFGHLELDGDRVVEFAEKPQTGEGWINGAFFVLEPEVFDYIDGDDTQFEREPLERLAKDGQLMAYRHDGFWQCMDTLRDKKLLEELWDAGDAARGRSWS